MDWTVQGGVKAALLFQNGECVAVLALDPSYEENFGDCTYE